MSAAPEMNEGDKNICILLNDGNKMPVIGLGTFTPDILSPESSKSESLTVTSIKDTDRLDQTITDCVKEAVKTALDIGYRHIDSAYVYQTEHIIGKVFQKKFLDGTLKREDLFCTSKLWNNFHPPNLVRPALERSLKALQLDYVDLYLIHFPISLKPGENLFPVDENGDSAFGCVDLCQTWEALEQCKDAGLVKSIGVSNFSSRQLEMILNKPGLKYKPVCNQIECHPYLNQSGLLDYCKSKDIVLAAYGVLGSPESGSWVDHSVPRLLQNPVLISIGEKYQKTPAQVSVRYLMQRGIVPIVKSFNPGRIKQNLQVFDFQLSPEDMKAIDGINQNLRYWKFPMWEGHPHHHYHIVE